MAEFNPGGATSLDQAVKLRYEANADTNVFTDAERAKLGGVAAGATANATDAGLRDRATHTGMQPVATVSGLQAVLDGKAEIGHGHAEATTGSAGFLRASDKAKLDGIAAGATVNSPDAYLKDRVNHAGTQAIATVTGLQSALDVKAALGMAQSFTAAQGTAVVTLTDGATIATDASLSNQFKVVLGGNRTMAAPTSLVEGRLYEWEIKQDATGGRALTWASLFRWPGGTAPTLQTGAGASDIITARYNGTNLHCVHSGGWAA